MRSWAQCRSLISPQGKVGWSHMREPGRTVPGGGGTVPSLCTGTDPPHGCGTQTRPGMEGQSRLNPTEHLLCAAADGEANVPSGDSSAYLVALVFALLLVH